VQKLLVAVLSATALVGAGPAYATPTVNFDIGPWPGVQNSPVTFTARVTCDRSPCTYRWYQGTASSTNEFGTSGPQPRETVIFTYTTTGTREVTLKVQNSVGQTGVWTRAFNVVAPTSPPPLPPVKCANGVDDDGDGLTDMSDQGCSSASDNDESNVLQPASSGTKYGFHQGLGYFGDYSYWGPRLNATAGIGSQVSRGTMLWSVVEPSNDAFNFTRYDNLVAAIKAKNMVPVFDLARSPRWANGSSDGWVIPSDPAAYNTFVSEYAEFAGRVAARYAGQGVLYEVWNEPNERYFWKGPAPSIDRYAQLFTTARKAMLAADPSAKVALGGITGLGAGCCISGRDFISGLVDRGVQFEYAGIHAYVSGLRGPDSHVNYQQNLDDVLMIHNLLESRGRRGIQLWLTEWGWYGCSPDDATKAAWVKRGHERIRNEWSSFVTISAYFMDRDEPAYPCAGVFNSSLGRKATASAFQQFRATVG
jgi:hypothetical protein